MAVKLLFYREQTRYINHPDWIRNFLNLNKIHPIIIDEIGDLVGKSKTMEVYSSLEEAVAANREALFVWLDAGGEIYLDEFPHPEDNDDVVYCVGSDYSGFGDATGKGPKVKLRQLPEHTGEWFAAFVVPLVCYDRFLYLNGRRR